MLLCELEDLLGSEISMDDFEIINECYMFFDYLFPNKKEVADYYKKNGLCSFELLLKEKHACESKLSNYQEKMKKLNTLVKDLESNVNFMIKEREEVKSKIKKVHEILKIDNEE